MTEVRILKSNHTIKISNKQQKRKTSTCVCANPDLYQNRLEEV